jgi:hypothetical protein
MKAVIKIKNFKGRRANKVKEYVEKAILARDLVELVKSGEVDVDEIERKPLKLGRNGEFNY